MEALIEAFIGDLYMPWLLAAIAGCIVILGKSADCLVNEAVALSERSGVPKVVIGATVVSLGTTTPEAAVSVLAALQGQPDVALGNAVGSIICDTGLVLGAACLIAPLRLPRRIVNRQGWLQLGAGILLVAACWPWSAPKTAFSEAGGGNLPQVAGFGFIALLLVYLWLSARWSRQQQDVGMLEEHESDVASPILVILVKLLTAVAFVVLSSDMLIRCVTEMAERMHVPQEIIAGTLIAFGTSLPELVTGVRAAWRGHGDLAVGNVIGADILNVLFVAGAAAAVTPAGLVASPVFFRLMFPAMLCVLIVFRVGIIYSRHRGNTLPRPFGFVLLATYLVYLCVICVHGAPGAGALQ